MGATTRQIVTQALLPTSDNMKRVAAVEVLLPDDAVRNLIRQAKIEQVYSVMQTGTTRGMQTMEQSLADLVLRGTVTLETALACSRMPRVAPCPSSTWLAWARTCAPA